jgi:hypothetical protein
LLGSYIKHSTTFEQYLKTWIEEVKEKYPSVYTAKLDDVEIGRSRTANLAYAAYLPAGKWMFSGARNISLSEKNKLDIALEFKQVEFDKPLSFPFSIPKNYRIIN